MLSKYELSDFRSEVCRRTQLDASNRAFWSSLRVLCEYSMADDVPSQSAGSGELNSGVHADVSAMFSGKTAFELDELQEQISQQLQVN